MKRCHACLKGLADKTPVGRRETCLFCGSDLHCCLNCAFHAIGAYNECHESQAERVVDKDRGNFCDYFVFRDGGTDGTGKDSGVPVKSKIEALFKSG